MTQLVTTASLLFAIVFDLSPALNTAVHNAQVPAMEATVVDSSGIVAHGLGPVNSNAVRKRLRESSSNAGRFE